MDRSQVRKFESMAINMDGDWTARELKSFVGSVNLIYNSFYILQMIWNNDIHDKVIQRALNQMEKYRSIESLSQWKEVIDSLEASCQALPHEEFRSVKEMFTNEIFKTLEQYISIREKLAIESIDHGSPGGVTYTALPPISTRPETKSKTEVPEKNPKTEVPEKSPLRETQEILADIQKDAQTKKLTNDDILEETMLKYRTIDPELMQMVKGILVASIENLKKLVNSNKIANARMVTSKKPAVKMN